ncbi:MAG: hypothetical protein GY953_59125, partial [bacterium]|nr:hypothetical protein [bacterium]
MPIKTSVHGHNFQLEYSNIGSIQLRGGYVRYSGITDQVNWLHAAVPTPNEINGRQFHAEKVAIRYRIEDPSAAIALSQIAKITAVHVYDGERLLTTHDNLDLGDIGDPGWHTVLYDVTDHAPLEHALGVSVG